jgi:hypothetical protein
MVSNVEISDFSFIISRFQDIINLSSALPLVFVHLSDYNLLLALLSIARISPSLLVSCKMCVCVYVSVCVLCVCGVCGLYVCVVCVCGRCAQVLVCYLPGSIQVNTKFRSVGNCPEFRTGYLQTRNSTVLQSTASLPLHTNK